jgi:DNA-binding transcriptional MerR regulator
MSASDPSRAADEVQPVEPADETWRVDRLAQMAGLPVRTIREYQTIGLLPPPRREGRVGLYGTTHLHRLQLIARLQDRGYSLAGIADLLGQWGAGADLADVLGLDADQLVHIDEPGRPATLDQLVAVLPTLVPDHLEALVDHGVVERCGPDRFCVPSPSLLQLTADAVAAGVERDRIFALLAAFRASADAVARETIELLRTLPSDGDPTATATLLGRGRGLLAHGVGRLTIHTIGRELGVDSDADLATALERIQEHRP